MANKFGEDEEKVFEVDGENVIDEETLDSDDE